MPAGVMRREWRGSYQESAMGEPREQQRLASVAVVEKIIERVASESASSLTNYGLTYKHSAYEFWVERHDEPVPVHRFTSGSIEDCTHAETGRAERACKFVEDSVRNGIARLG
jgi:hypothetical protein